MFCSSMGGIFDLIVPAAVVFSNCPGLIDSAAYLFATPIWEGVTDVYQSIAVMGTRFNSTDLVMSSSSTVTYTSVYTNSEPGRVLWGADEELSDGDSDPKEGPEDNSKEDHAEYLTDGGDDDNKPSDDDDDDTDDDDEEPFEDEDDDEEEEDHLALTDSYVVPVVDPVPLARDTEAFETDESAPTPRSPQTKVPYAQTRLRRARKTIRLEPPMSLSMEIPLSPLLPLPVLLSMPPPVDHREDVPEVELPPCKRLCSTAPTSKYEVGQSSTAAPGPTGGHRDSHLDAGPPYRCTGVIDSDAGCIGNHNNMPLRRNSAATPRAAAVVARDAAATAAAPITVAAVEQLIKERVFAALANYENL
ncbi:hypothetical protein Tco_0525043 [Tanacetum coccineum]